MITPVAKHLRHIKNWYIRLEPCRANHSNIFKLNKANSICDVKDIDNDVYVSEAWLNIHLS